MKKKRYAVTYKYNLDTGNFKVHSHKRKDGSDQIKSTMFVPFSIKSGKLKQ